MTSLFFLFLIANPLIGVVVWTLIDSKGEIYKWYSSAPQLGFIGPIVQFLVVNAWPVGLYFWFKRLLDKAKREGRITDYTITSFLLYLMIATMAVAAGVVSALIIWG